MRHIPTLEILLDLLLALGLSSVIGFEREMRQRSAGLRTHSLVGLGSALFVVVSKYGFFDVVGPDVTLDPSRVAAQVVSGIGFIGGGLIFVRRDAVKGLTTSASVWLTAGVGMACGAGAGLQWIAVAATASELVIMLGFTAVSSQLDMRRSPRMVYQVDVRYLDGRGALRHIINRTTALGFTLERMLLAGSAQDTGPAVSAETTIETRSAGNDGPAMVELSFSVSGYEPMDALAAAVTSVSGVKGVAIAADADAL